MQLLRKALISVAFILGFGSSATEAQSIGSETFPALSPASLKVANPSATSGYYWFDPDGIGSGQAPFIAYADQLTAGGGWLRVRHIAPDGTWFPGTDDLSGVYSLNEEQAVVDSSAKSWSLPFSQFINAGTEFLFKSGDGSAWCAIRRGSTVFNGSNGSAATQILDSFGVGLYPGELTTVLHQSIPETPWIGCEGSHEQNQARMLYGENGSTDANTAFKDTHGGIDIFVRKLAQPNLTTSGTVSAGWGSKANVLFIFDNSGSMADIITTQTPFDPSKNYLTTASCGATLSSRVFFSTTSVAPSCSSTSWVNASAVACDAANTAFTSSGFYIGRIGRYDASRSTGFRRWSSLLSSTPSHTVECQADSGIHGLTAASAAKYAKDDTSNADTGYTATASSSIDWTRQTTFTLYSANYVAWYNTARNATQNSKINIARDTLKSVLLSSTDLSVGLMYFSYNNQGGMVAVPVNDITTNRATISSVLDGINAETFTPLSETLYEAALYFGGKTWLYGQNATKLSGAIAVPNPSVVSSRLPSETTTYKSPITSPTDKNIIIYLTDGDPTTDSDANTRIASLIGFATCDTIGSVSNPDGICLDDLAGYLHTNDVNDAVPGIQTIEIHTIGLATDQVLLSRTANRGGGSYSTVSDAASLSAALSNILSSIPPIEGITASAGSSVHLNSQAFTTGSVSGQRKLRLQSFSDGRVLATYADGTPSGCTDNDACQNPAILKHLAFDATGMISGPQQSLVGSQTISSAIPASIATSGGGVVGSGTQALVGLEHTRTDGSGGFFLSVNSTGQVLARDGGTGYANAVNCTIGNRLLSISSATGSGALLLQEWDSDIGLIATNSVTTDSTASSYQKSIACGYSASLGTDYFVLSQKVSGSAAYLSLFIRSGSTWARIGATVSVPTSSATTEALSGGGLATTDDRGVLLFRDRGPDDRRSMYLVRFNLSAAGILLTDAAPRPIVISSSTESLDGAVTYGGNGFFYAVAYSGGNGTDPQLQNTSQRIELFQIGSGLNGARLIDSSLADTNWSNSSEFDVLGLNSEGFAITRSCDGNLYYGGSIDDGTGHGAIKVFRVGLSQPTCGSSASLSASITGPRGNAGWFVGDIDYRWTIGNQGFDNVNSVGCGSGVVDFDTRGFEISCAVTNPKGTSSRSYLVRRDSVAPLALPEYSSMPNTNGWYKSPVTVSYVGTDATSGVVACSNSSTIGTEGENQIPATGTCTDAAGNISTPANVNFISLDMTPPVVSTQISGMESGGGWRNVATVISFSASDSLSGVAVDGCAVPKTLSTDGAGQSVTGECVDLAGNIASATATDINIDRTAPVVAAEISPLPNAAGWFNSQVTVSFAGADSMSGSGIAGCSPPVLLNTDGVNFAASGSCSDIAGNITSKSVAGINIDRTAPVASAAITPPPNAAGWHKAPASISFSGTESLGGSGLVGCSAASTVSTDGAAQVRSGTCTDVAGNISNSATATVNLDSSAPTVSVISPTSGGSYVQNSANGASYSCADALSGIIGCLGTVPSGSTFSTSTVGSNSFTVQATDLAGNTASRTVSYTVTSPPLFTLSPSSLAFGDRLLNSSTSLVVTIRNSSTGVLALTVPALSGTNANQFTLTRTCATSLAANASCIVTATFKPTTAGAKTAAFSIRVGTSTQTVPLTGNGIAVAFTVSPTSLTFPSQARNVTSVSQTVTVTNSVAFPITLPSPTLGAANANQFVKTQTCGTTLAANASCTVSISFKPNAAGTKTATLTVTPSGATAKTVAITGVSQ